MIQDYIALDLETTGLNPSRDRILEIGAIRVRAGREEAVFCTLVDCGMHVPDRICGLTGITDLMIQEAKACGQAMDSAEAVSALVDFCEDLPLLGHNILFDYSFVKRQAVNQGLTFEREGIDTLKIAKKFLGDLPSRRLDALCSYYQIEAKGHHRAAADAESAALLYEKLAECFETSGPEEFLPQKLVYEAKKQSPITKFQKAYLIDLVKYHKITLDVSVETLTKNEASRRIDQIISNYGRIKR